MSAPRGNGADETARCWHRHSRQTFVDEYRKPVWCRKNGTPKEDTQDSGPFNPVHSIRVVQY
ncbi:protein of unknown function [Paraburkholderia dioscoreae]|uniref:Uncharacterized protein n=1 Tax=Paraburkholderia dioscoreae TaxID=2604047 RepID=A0A5Q4ZLX1_9BURK|nr:protein of unknown function [Paraburkholderia dioscoreae]